MSFNNYKPDIAVVRNATPTTEQIAQLHDLGLDLATVDLSKEHFITWVGGLRAYGSINDVVLGDALELELWQPVYPEYVESDAVFDTIDELIEALKP